MILLLWLFHLDLTLLQTLWTDWQELTLMDGGDLLIGMGRL